MAARVSVLPSPRCLFDDPVQIRVAGLQPQQAVTLRASLVDESGELFQSHALYRAGSSGELDLSRSPALGGSYLGVEPMGLLWALRSKTPHKRLAKRNVLTPFCVDLEVYEGHGDTSRLLGKCTNERWFLGEGVKRISVREGRLRATLFLPPGPGPFPGLIDLYGSGGGLIEYRASLLASRGFVTLALAYMSFEDIPAMPDILELSYFEEAVNFLRKQQQVKDTGIGVLGLSKGGDLALSIATFLPGIKAAVSISGSSFNSFIPLKGDGFTIPVHPYDLGRMKISDESGTVDFSDVLDDHMDPATWDCRIPVERSLAKFLFLSGLDDMNWKSDLYCRDAVQRLQQHGREVEFYSYSGAGHLLEPPYLPLCKISIHRVLGMLVHWGGQWREHAKAQEDAWRRIQAFFWRHLMDSDIPKMTASDCYVRLWLPSASPGKLQTKTIRNSDNPVWNETFYFRIQREVENILELAVCDEDALTKDDMQFTVLFNVARIRPGERIRETFALKSETERCYKKWESLEVEFWMERVPGPPEHLITNDVLVSREVCCLEVHVDINESRKYLKEGKNLVLTVPASHERTQKTTEDTDTFYFHCVKAWEPVLKVRLQKVSDKEDDNSNLSDTLTVPLKFLPVGHKVKVTLPVRHNVPLQLYLQLNACTEKLDLRLGYDLCQGEQEFLQKRKRVVAGALKRVLHLERDLHGHEVPVIAVMATGGGLRAMSAMFGHLLALQKLNLLDCVTYLTGASGSTWTLADLYEHADWSQKSLEGPLKAVKEQVTKCKLNLMSIDHLKYYHKELAERAKAGHVPSFTTLWSLVQEMFLHERPRKYKLTDQRKALEHGQNPLPFYAVLNVKEEKYGTFKFREWTDFSPYEVAIPKYGVSIPSEYFDSEFFMGRRVKKLPESRICYLEGLWTNIFTRNLLDGLYWSSNSNEFWERWSQDMVDIEKHSPEEDVTVIEPPSCLSGKLYEMFQDIMTKRPLLGKSHNFLRGLEFHKDYIHQKKFIEWKDTVLDGFPNNLTPLQKYLCLIDVGYFINTSGAALFKPERNVDVIISLDYGLGHVFKQLEMTYKYCKIQNIPFPKVELSPEEEKNPKECYIFADAEDPRAPIVIHFPLVNDTFKEFKEPGVKRGHSEMEEGKVNLENNCSPYYLIRLIYSSENFDKLVNLSKYNILNNKDLLLQAIRSAVERRRSRRTGNFASYSGYP
ncbi:cytosolic phospholipase A2 beta-like isoform X1 [Motacilla alba alba]|uniref:cytosolic phospholipase A2 beta-like isoform X1 n=1 Tax=Motacilla alba alba TaxID=1094192 RepID=UPI0018D56995|nr:cytosolic phospholipase A2 beta-like isoform X1 [Motacilla alba alba]